MKGKRGHKVKGERVNKVKGFLLSIFNFHFSIVLFIFIFQFSFCYAKSDSIYNCTQIKLDILSPVLIPGITHWQMQHYEAAVNVRLANRFYPTLEAGYAGGRLIESDTVSYRGQGGFFRAGVDINPLKKHPESPHALLVGIRLGSGYQDAKADCWGEIVAGCQVEIAKGERQKVKGNRKEPMAFYMGWMGRIKFLFTRATEDKNGIPYPAYIPGYGNRDNIGWGANYYLGWRF